MIKKIRRSFITTAMLSVTIVLAVIVAVLNIANYINSDNEAEQLLRFLAGNGGSFAMPPDEFREMPEGETPPEKPDGSEKHHSDEELRFDPQAANMFVGMWGRGFMTEETPYETRFFTVLMGSDGKAAETNTGKIAAVTNDEAAGIAAELMSAGKKSGYYGNYRFLASDKDNGILYIFVDRTQSLRSVSDIMLISILVAVGAAAAIFLLVIVFSRIFIKPIAESYEKQTIFITNAGHELKTPLAVINSCNEVIELEQGETKWTQSIAAQTEKLSALTNELVALARMDEGTVLTKEEFPLSETAEEILDPYVLMAERKGLTLTSDIQPDIMYKGDRNMIARLFSVLADNALKYTPDGGSISFRLSAKNKKITFRTENTAQNVEKGDHPELFDRFRRGDASHNGAIP
ncbi:MAG: HAMP domain-containing histidine kinase, partial [Ruminiclostridium sp.]|nr:HAMP domain-containing histidine kinase [Ruminiclostridium sp.]